MVSRYDSCGLLFLRELIDLVKEIDQLVVFRQKTVCGKTYFEINCKISWETRPHVMCDILLMKKMYPIIQKNDYKKETNLRSMTLMAQMNFWSVLLLLPQSDQIPKWPTLSIPLCLLK